MANDIQITISGNDAQLLSVWQRQNAEIIKQQKALLQMADAGEKAGNRVGAGMKSATQDATKFITAITGVGSAVGAVALIAQTLKREYEDLVQRQRKAADAQIGLADAQSQAIINLGTDKDVDSKRLFEEIRKISKETGLSERDTTLAASDALSARGDKSALQALAAVKASTRLLPYNPEAAKLLSGAVLDISKGSNISPEAAAGFFTSVSRAARVTDFQGTAEHIAPGIIGVSKFGDDLRQAGALVSTLSLGEADPTGRRSRTASISLAKQLEERFPGLADTEARIRAVQSSAAEYKKFFEGGRYRTAGGRLKKFEGATFEATALPTVRGLLSSDAGTQERKEYEASLENVIDPAKGEKVYGEVVGQIDALRSVQAARLQRAFKGSAETGRIDDILSGRTAISREGLEEILESRGFGYLNRKAAGLSFELDTAAGRDPTEKAIEILGERRDDLRSPFAPHAREDERNAEELGKIVALLQQLLAEQRGAQGKPIELKIEADVPVRAKAGPGAGNDRRNVPGPRGGEG